MENPFEEILRELAAIREEMKNPLAEKTITEIIDRKELCQRLALTEPTIINWTKRGKIPQIKIGSAIRYDWIDVLEKLKNQK